MKKILNIYNYKYVSFDLFDTLIFRNVISPRNVFPLVDYKLKQNDININNFSEVRVNAEKQACNNLHGSEEISLCSIYRYIPFLSENDRDFALNMEIEVEKRVCTPNEYMLNILYKCKERGSKIIITTDMYLPKEAIESILRKCDITYDYLFLSSDTGVRKSTGNMYKHILKVLNIEKKDLIHIGDNFKSDYIVPKLLSVASVRYKRKLIQGKQKHYDCSSNDICDCLKRNNQSSNAYFNIGYNYFGQLIMGFSQWLYKEYTTKKFNRILFFSRDGFIMQKAFHLLYPNIQSEYVYVSRRSLTVPKLTNVKSWREIIDTIAYIKREETWDTLFHKIGLEDYILIEKYKKEYGEYVSKKDLLCGKYDSVFDDISDAIHHNAIKERLEAKKYLEPLFDGKVAIVDIGWYGTMQKSLLDFFENQTLDITGYYLGYLKKEGYPKMNAFGYLYDYINGDSFNRKLIFGFNGLIETFFTANHGSAKKYQNGIAELEEWEKANWSIIEEIHNGALDFCKDIEPYINEYNIEINSSIAFGDMNRLMSQPTKEDIRLLGDLVFYDTYYEPLVKTHKSLIYLTNPKLIIKDFLSSNWKIGFIKKVFHLFRPDIFYLSMLHVK